MFISLLVAVSLLACQLQYTVLSSLAVSIYQFIICGISSLACQHQYQFIILALSLCLLACQLQCLVSISISLLACQLQYHFTVLLAAVAVCYVISTSRCFLSHTGSSSTNSVAHSQKYQFVNISLLAIISVILLPVESVYQLNSSCSSLSCCQLQQFIISRELASRGVCLTK